MSGKESERLFAMLSERESGKQFGREFERVSVKASEKRLKRLFSSQLNSLTEFLMLMRSV